VTADSWRFDAQEATTVRVPAAPTFERYQEYFEIAVPALASEALELPHPVMIVARVSAKPAPGRQLPAGPRDRAKALMDALHDQRRKPPFYRDLGRPAPLTDDKPHFVRGLAVEVRPSPVTSTEYRFGSELLAVGRVMTAADVDLLAPNDIWVSPSSRERIERAREAFAAALVSAWPRAAAVDLVDATALVVRHQPDRDEDNTWSHWLGAVTGRPAWSQKYWGSAPPLAAWRPRAMASVSDPALPCATRIEVLA
jgi:hypothetical protein